MSNLPPQLKGAAVEASAIAHFCALGFTVSIPFSPTSYDLVVERDGVFNRIQCKYTTVFKGYGYDIEFRQLPTLQHFDLLFCMTGDGKTYLVPVGAIHGLSWKTSAQWEIAISRLTTERPIGRCRRCHKAYDGTFAVCDECRSKTTIHQREYRARLREMPA